jgi:5-methyltetrahydropteroyltriglutamate--homocysteine methyltransferase
VLDHYIVPEFENRQEFSLVDKKPLEQFLEAKELGILTRPVLLGPISFLLLGKSVDDALTDTLSLLPSLLPVYEELLTLLANAGAEWVQIDEPALILDLDKRVKDSFITAYNTLGAVGGLNVLLATYFEDMTHNLDFVINTPISGVHLDLVRAPAQLEVLQNFPKNFVVSLGLINGRNIWKVDYERVIEIARSAVAVLGEDRVIIGPSCSLLHCPHSLEAETKMDPEILNWLAFSKEKLEEISVITKVLNGGEQSVQEQLARNKEARQSRLSSSRIHDPLVQARMQAINESMMSRKSAFPLRHKKQQESLKLPLFPTTTIGSFPQTQQVRVNRANLKKKSISATQYKQFVKDETERCIRFQERVGLDVLVDGEFDRNDMVEFFGENMNGYVFTQNGWVQSYGSRGVKPPIIFGDVSRPNPITLDMTLYAQSLTKKPIKGMMTGPVTMLQWSFVRDDQVSEVICHF